MAPFETLYGRKCRTPLCWSDLDEALTLGPELIQETTGMIRKIQKHTKAAQNRKKKLCRQKEKTIRVSSER